jgi:hypothetical protein
MRMHVHAHSGAVRPEAGQGSGACGKSTPVGDWHSLRCAVRRSAGGWLDFHNGEHLHRAFGSSDPMRGVPGTAGNLWGSTSPRAHHQQQERNQWNWKRRYDFIAPVLGSGEYLQESLLTHPDSCPTNGVHLTRVFAVPPSAAGNFLRKSPIQRTTKLDSNRSVNYPRRRGR